LQQGFPDPREDLGPYLVDKTKHGHNGEPPKGSYCTPQIQVVVLIQAAPGPSSFKIKENISTEHEIDIDLKKESVNLMSVPDTCVQ